MPRAHVMQGNATRLSGPYSGTALQRHVPQPLAQESSPRKAHGALIGTHLIEVAHSGDVVLPGLSHDHS